LRIPGTAVDDGDCHADETRRLRLRLRLRRGQRANDNAGASTAGAATRSCPLSTLISASWKPPFIEGRQPPLSLWSVAEV
jgi:hypothetical protein